MNKHHYDYFANLIWDFAKKNKIDLLHCQSSPHHEIIELKQEPYYISYHIKIQTQAEFIQLFKKKKMYVGNNDLKHKVFSFLFLNNHGDDFDFLIKNYQYFFHELPLSVIIPIVSQLGIEKISQLLSDTNIVTSGNFEHLKLFIEAIKYFPNAPTVISNYILKESSYYNGSYHQEELIKIFIHHFDSLNEFSSLEFIQNYLNHKKQPIFQHSDSEVFSISVNLKSLHAQHLSSHYRYSEYVSFLNFLINVLVEVDDCQYLSHKTVYSDFEIDSPYYKKTHIFIALTDNSVLNLSHTMLENMIMSFFDYVEQSSDFKEKRKSDVQQWLNTFFLSYQLEKDLCFNQSISRHKI